MMNRGSIWSCCWWRASRGGAWTFKFGAERLASLERCPTMLEEPRVGISGRRRLVACRRLVAALRQASPFQQRRGRDQDLRCKCLAAGPVRAEEVPDLFAHRQPAVSARPVRRSPLPFGLEPQDLRRVWIALPVLE